MYDDVYEPTGHLFAYQEIDKNKFTLQNQKDIFGSVSSLMKAEFYEMNSLERRKSDLVIYNFNLLSIIDTELVKLHYKDKGNKISTEEIKDAKAIFNYIVNKQETASRIHFCTLNSLENISAIYDKLHNYNCQFFQELYNEFYKNILYDKNNINLLKNEFISAILWKIHWELNKTFTDPSSFSDIDVRFSNLKNTLEISLKATSSEIDFLNNNLSINSLTKRKLENIYCYSGTFEFTEDDMPF